MARFAYPIALALLAAAGCASIDAGDDTTTVGDGGNPFGQRPDLRVIPCPGKDVMNDPMNCGVCMNVCKGANVAANGCRGGQCVVGTCNPGYFDVDDKGMNGCECRLEQTETPATSQCSGAAMVSGVHDGMPSKVEIVGNLVPKGDEDWYLVRSMDDPEQDGMCSRYDLKIKFAENPGDAARFDVYDDCGMPAKCSGGEHPTGLLEYEWNSNGAADEVACPCYAMDPPAD